MKSERSYCRALSMAIAARSANRLEELLVLLFEDRGAKRAVHVNRADHHALGHQRYGDDRPQVLHDHRLLTLESVVEAGVGRDDRVARRDHVLDDRA